VTPAAADDRRDTRTAIGAVVGGVIGNQVSDGDTGATVAGAVVGGLIGRSTARGRAGCRRGEYYAERRCWRSRGHYIQYRRRH
ncbi:MAG TPA: glycine zipper 2TM domain-containing protein, partial [Caulobacteraceae bacterium]